MPLGILLVFMLYFFISHLVSSSCVFSLSSAGLVGAEMQDLSQEAIEGIDEEVIPKIPASTLKV